MVASGTITLPVCSLVCEVVVFFVLATAACERLDVRHWVGEGSQHQTSSLSVSYPSLSSTQISFLSWGLWVDCDPIPSDQSTTIKIQRTMPTSQCPSFCIDFSSLPFSVQSLNPATRVSVGIASPSTSTPRLVLFRVSTVPGGLPQL